MDTVRPRANQSLSLEARVVALEARFEIGQLVVRYSIAADSRDLESIVALFEPNVRESLRGEYLIGLKQFYRSFHQLCGHRVELLTPDTARGLTYCRAEHEVADRWIVADLCYFDDYVLVDQQWLFANRVPRILYAADQLERPQQAQFGSWTGSDAPSLPAVYATWKKFWGDHDTTSVTSHPLT